MSYSLFSAVDFGTGRAGLTTVGYRLYDHIAGFSARVTAGVAEITDGKFGALVAYPDGLIGAEVWDSGETIPIYALNVINPPAAATIDNAAVADAVWDTAIADHLTAGSTGAKLNSAAAAGDPWSAALPGSYAAHEAGAILAKLDIGPPADPIFVIPGPPADLSLCRVFAYVETLINAPKAGVSVRFDLVQPDPVKSDRLICTRSATARTDVDGYLQIDLQRNDSLQPDTTKYQVSCEALGLRKKEIALTTDTFDLASVVA
jgi:hypothetical protein